MLCHDVKWFLYKCCYTYQGVWVSSNWKVFCSLLTLKALSEGMYGSDVVGEEMGFVSDK
jgi:hypothetical protein